MVRNVAVVTWYVCGRKRGDLPPGQEDEVTCQVWLVLTVCPEGAETASEPAVDVGSAHKSGERLKETVAEVLAGRLEGAVWKTTDDLSEDQVAGLLAGLPDMVKTLAEKPLDILGDAAGLPVPVVSLGADITATLVLKPVLEPLQSAVHILEVAGIVLGFATGMHPLVLTCVKHLAYDELGETLTHAFEQIMSPADAQAVATHHRPDMEPVSAGPGFDSGYIALCRLAESAAVSARSRHTAAAVDHDSASPRRRSISPITGILDRENSGTVNGKNALKLSLELAASLEIHRVSVTGLHDDNANPATGLFQPRSEPASVTDPINAVYNRSALS